MQTYTLRRLAYITHDLLSSLTIDARTVLRYDPTSFLYLVLALGGVRARALLLPLLVAGCAHLFKLRFRRFAPLTAAERDGFDECEEGPRRDIRTFQDNLPSTRRIAEIYDEICHADTRELCRARTRA